MKVLIVDDEALARARLRALLQAHADVQVIAEAENGQQALDALSGTVVDLVLLDIRMPGLDGMAVAKQLANTTNAPAIVFCTAYDEHALAAFDARAIDYLLKPVNRDRLAEALTRVRNQASIKTDQPDSKIAARTQLGVRVRGELKLVPITDVIYLMADAKYVEIHRKQDVLLIEESLIQLEEEFAERFIRIHRNCLVAKDAILGLGKSEQHEVVVLLRDCPDRLEVSRRNVAAIKKRLKRL